MTEEETIQKKINDLDRELVNLRRRQSEDKRNKRQRLEETFEKTKGIHVNCSDDYATLTVGCFGPVYNRYKIGSMYDFYYGYEQTVCPIHGADKCECDDTEWAFVAKKDGQEFLRLPASALHPGMRDMAECLLCGIGLWLAGER